MRIVKIMLVALLCLSTLSSHAQKRKENKAKEETAISRYEIECIGTGKEGTYLLKVWVYSKNVKVAIEAAKRNAIHGVIFKGFAGVGSFPSQNPLIANSDIEQKNAQYFAEFFETGGPYLRYVSISEDGKGMYDMVNLRRTREWKVGIIVWVSKDALRKKLEADNIIRGLASGF